jgi:hypothetical protein
MPNSTQGPAPVVLNHTTKRTEQNEKGLAGRYAGTKGKVNGLIR